MEVQELESFLNSISSVRLHIKGLLLKKENLQSMRDLYLLSLNSNQREDLRREINKYKSNYLVIKDSALCYPLIVRNNIEMTPIESYNIKKLKNSIVKNIFLSNELTINQKNKMYNYLLYYFYVMNSDFELNKITERVIIDIEDTISDFIENDGTKFIDYDMTNITNKLRNQLLEEKLFAASGA